MLDEYLNSDNKSTELMRAQIKHLNNELKVTKAEQEKTIKKHTELNSNLEEKIKDRSNKLEDVQNRLEIKTKELEQERSTLKNSEQRFKDLFQNSPEAIIVINKKHKIIGINPAACLMFNKNKRDLIGDVPYFNAHDRERIEMMKTYNQICSCKQSYVESKLWTVDNVVLPVEISANSIRYLGQEALVLHIHDMSIRIESEEKVRSAMEMVNEHNKKLEDMLEERTKDLIRTERHAAFSLLIQGLVHNLRNPLNGVSGGAQTILMNKEMLEKKNVTIPDELKKPLEMSWRNANAILKSSNKLVKIIDSMMAKSKSDNTEEIESVDLNEIVSQELEFLDTDTQFKHTIRKSIFLINGELRIDIVPSELSQIFQNLVRNALDAIYYNKEAMLEIRTGRKEEKVWFSIQDNGSGIPKDIQSKIFDPFFSTKPKAKENKSGEPVGTGLGLHICSEMVNAYNGKIELKSKEKIGTKVTVYFPAVQTA